MTDPRQVMERIRPRVSKILTMAEAALPPQQFRAFRKLTLDEFGWSGLEGELMEFMNERQTKRKG